MLEEGGGRGWGGGRGRGRAALAGLVLRLLALTLPWSYSSTGSGVSSYNYSYSLSWGSELAPWQPRPGLAECVFLLRAGGGALPAAAGCPAGARLVALPFSLLEGLGSFSTQVDAAFLFLGIAGQLITYMLLCSLCGERSERKRSDERCLDCAGSSVDVSAEKYNHIEISFDPAKFYWLNPVSILVVISSPLPGIFHALLLSTIVLATGSKVHSSPLHIRHIMQNMCLIFNCSLLIAFFPITFPLILVLFINNGNAMTNLSLLRFGALLVVVIGAVVAESLDTDLFGKSVSLQQEYNPGFGVMWYMHAQAFSKYSSYFTSLIKLQPFIYVLPLSIRLSGQPLVSAFVILAISLLLCSDDASVADLILVLCCFATQNPILSRMRYVSFLIPLLIVSCLGTPLMLQSWIQFGTGNANFAFFLGLGISVAIVIIIVEFTRSAMNQRKL